LGAFNYETALGASPDRPCSPIAGGDALTTCVCHVGSAHRLTVAHPGEIPASENIRLVHHATCCSLLADGARRAARHRRRGTKRRATSVPRRREIFRARRKRD
jgi:hypothetical protein